MGDKVGRKICEWPFDAGAEVQYRLENWQEFGFEKQPAEEEVCRSIDDDHVWMEQQWLDMCDAVHESVFSLRSTTGFWFAEVENFGWRRLNGHKVFKATTVSELLTRILPDCDCNFVVYKLAPGGIAINNAHHDSPTWEEWYFVRPISQARFEREG